MDDVMDYHLENQSESTQMIKIPLTHLQMLKDIDLYGYQLKAEYLNIEIKLSRRRTYWQASFKLPISDSDKLAQLKQIIQFGRYEYQIQSAPPIHPNRLSTEPATLFYEFTFRANGPTDYAPVNLSSPIFDDKLQYRDYLTVLTQVYDLIKFLVDNQTPLSLTPSVSLKQHYC